VVILRFDKERERVSLGYKQRFEDPWILVPEKYPVGKRVEGKVVSIVDYGAFVVLEEGVEGLIHVSEMSWTKKVKNPRSILEVGEEVEVVVSEVDPEKRRLSLSLRATEPNPWEQVAETYSVGAKIKGKVRNLTDFGAFVEIVPGVDGLVHISDMSWTRRINHPNEVVQKGDDVEAVITSVDSYNQRISLSMKELLPNEWEEYANTHGVGDVATGKITNVTDFGIFVELSPGVEGLCHISEIDRDEGLSLAEMFSPGQSIRCRILRIDWHESRIGLSMHALEQDGVEDDAAVEADDSSATETAMAAALRAGGLVEEGEDEDSVTVQAEGGDQAKEEPVVEASDAAQEEPATDDGDVEAADGETDEAGDAEPASEGEDGGEPEEAEASSESEEEDEPKEASDGSSSADDTADAKSEGEAEAESDAEMGAPAEEADGDAEVEPEGENQEKKD
jgi:small subunit ribosomal protein S1